MDWRLAMEAERAVLARIAALLFALADLTELSCSRSRAVRGVVLWLLLPAEAVVQVMLTGTPAPMPLRQTANSPADAMRLASSFRSQAAAVLDLSCRALLCADEQPGVPGEQIGVSFPDGRISALIKAISTGILNCRPAPCDTS